jgi:hypothetical protein
MIFKRFRVEIFLLSSLMIIYLVACAQTTPATPTPLVDPTTTATGETVIMEPTAIGTTTIPVDRELQPAQSGPLSTFTTADFSGSSVCARCHIGLQDQSGADVSMPTDWRSTMMANAGIDPVWQAKVSSEVARLPKLQAVIEKKCTTCHMPMAETQAITDGITVRALEDGFFDPNHPLHTAAIDGVSCTLCHQVSNINLGEMVSFSGSYFIDTNTNAPNRLIYGPYTNPFGMPMQNQSGFNPVFGEHMLSAEHCATCHNLYTPYVDADGNILGEFPEQTPYTEWAYSEFGGDNQSCQSCHMPLAEGGVVISQMPMRLSPREPFFKHYFVGGNYFMLQILADWGGELEVSADQAELSTTQSRVLDQVENNTAQLSLQEATLDGNTLTAILQVNILTGHKFPTSFPSRRAWLHVTVTDANGKVVFESGKPNANGTITGNAADFDGTTYEPHYDLVTQADQVQIYEAIMANSDGEVTYTLLRAASYAKDNRLIPPGTPKADLPEDIAVYGNAASDSNFISGGDLVTYQIDVSEAQGPFTINAELLYETLSYRFVQDLLKDKTSLTNRFGTYYQMADKTPLVVAEIGPTTIR